MLPTHNCITHGYVHYISASSIPFHFNEIRGTTKEDKLPLVVTVLHSV